MSSEKASASVAGKGTIKKDEQDEDVNRLPLLSLIRHPETIANISHVLQGSTDSPLTVNGQQQAGRLAESIAKSVDLTWTAENDGQMVKAKGIHWIFNSDVVRAHGNTKSPLLIPGRPPTAILTSPAGRAHHLAQLISDAIRNTSNSNHYLAEAQREGQYTYPEVDVREKIAERCFGQREGIVYSRGQIKPVKGIIDPKERIGLQSESHQVFHQRVREEFENIIYILRAHQNDVISPHVVIITHGLWIRTALEIAFGQVRQPFTQNTGIFTLALLDQSTRALSARPNGLNMFGLVCQNDTTHLIGLKRQRGGIGSMASDRNQQTLQTLWQSPTKRVRTEDVAASKDEDERDEILQDLTHEIDVNASATKEIQDSERSPNAPEAPKSESKAISPLESTPDLVLDIKEAGKGKRESHIEPKQERKRQKSLFQMWNSTTK